MLGRKIEQWTWAVETLFNFLELEALSPVATNPLRKITSIGVNAFFVTLKTAAGGYADEFKLALT